MGTAIKTPTQLYFNKDHELVRHAVREFVNKEINPYVDEWEEAGIAPLNKLFKKMGKFMLLLKLLNCSEGSAVPVPVSSK